MKRRPKSSAESKRKKAKADDSDEENESSSRSEIDEAEESDQIVEAKSGRDKTNKKGSGDRAPKVKGLSKFERLEEARKAFKWWEMQPLPEGINWRHLEHPGVVFAPPYRPHHVPLVYDGAEVELTPEQEELASFFAVIPEDGPQLGNPATRKVFIDNFFAGFKDTFPSHTKINSFEKCDFSRIRDYLALQKNLQKAATDEEKEQKKAEKEQIILRYAYGLVDGRLEKLGNYNIEPPGLFRGRGEHPKTGTLKTRTLAESVSLNISSHSAIPKCTLPGHCWQSVRHDPAVTWLCSWTENVQSQNKYVMLAASSSFKGKSDQDKYTTAIQLKGCIERVRRDYETKIKSSDLSDRQMGTAMWVIDKLALRVGGEKGEEEADTYGCCSLLVDHLKFNPDADVWEIELEFLGKDSMLYKQNINFNRYGDIGAQVFRCLRSFCAGKDSQDQVFETLTPPALNRHLNSLMPGLTAKVFRTYNASVTLESELPEAVSLTGLSVQEKVLRYNAANRQVAILCNHQKTVSKATETMFENLNEKFKILSKQKVELEEWLKAVKKDKPIKTLKTDDKDIVERLQKQLQDAIAAKEAAATTEQKLQAAAAVEAAKALQRKDQNRKFLEKHMFKSSPSVESISSRIAKWDEDIRKLEADIRNRDENKEVALGTSKINYMDPRISVAWCKRCEVPIDKIFPKTLRDKFNWAMAVSSTWRFDIEQI